MPNIPDISAMKPRKDPIGTANLKDFKAASPLPMTGSGTTGMNIAPEMNKIDKYDPNKHLDKHLRTLNFGKYIQYYYDCEDRAFWGMAHLRHRFPGVPVGVASGIAKDGPFAGQPHAVIVLWNKVGEKIEPVYWDPEPNNQGVVGFGKIMSLVNFPPSKGWKNTPQVAGSLDGKMLVYDEVRIIYRKDDILRYLKDKPYENECENAGAHAITDKTAFDKMWARFDKALWAFAHARRDFPGSPVGVAYGDEVDGDSPWVDIVFYKEGDDDGGDLKYTYWDVKLDSEVKFKPRMIFI